ncbi:MAG: hypothetical protein KJO15_12425 [Alphaproteobacteria bacterium]|nr:hypothetical protein [Alphaproteobacteria bacterium]
MTTPPRLFVVTATASPQAMILRRGPSGQVATLGWNRDTDEITMGQWLKGRIYEHRCDLSPDGAHFIYFAGTGQRWWTAISRAPYLHALYFLPQDSTWQGGGAFSAPGTFWLNGGSGPAPETRELQQDPDPQAFPHSTDGFHLGDLYATRMAQRGWTASGTRYDTRLEKPLSPNVSLIQTIAIGSKKRALVSSAFGLFEPKTGTETAMPKWEWADLWNGALHVATGGVLWRAKVDDDEVTLTEPIHDFSEMSFEAIRAPYDRG